MKKRILSLFIVLSMVLTAISAISLPVYAISNIPTNEIETLVINYFSNTSGLDGEFVIFDNETKQKNEDYIFIVRYQGGSAANILYAMATVKTKTGEMFIDDNYVCNLWNVSDTEKDKDVSDEIKVILNGEEIEFDQPPVMINDRVMVPIRAIFEAMGYSVNWDGDTQTAEAIKSTNKITVQINNNIIKYTINGKSGAYECDVVPQIISERTLVPVRAIAESAGCDVQWDEENTTVIINYIL